MQKYFKILQVSVYTIVIFLSNCALSPADNLRDGVVKIFVTSNRMDYFRPWQSLGSSSATGSGCVISGHRILTNAHVVDDATFIQVRKESDPRKYTAKVEAIGHDADLAVLTVHDPDFFKDVPEAQFGELPFLQDSVIVIGFPAGGDKLSITEGVISRVELVPYSKSGKKLLAVQIDAAINPGNSGGPVYFNGKIVGIAMQVMNNSQNIGYIIPTPVIHHFLKDISDNHYDGFPSLGIETRNTENKSLRKYYQLDRIEGGVLVNRILQYSAAEKILKPGDTIVEVEGIPLAVDGTYEFRKTERLFFSHIISSKAMGDEVKMKIIRNGKPLDLRVKLTPYTNLVPPPDYFQKPTYYIYGGLIFSVLSADLLKAWGQSWWEKAPVPFLNYIVGSGILNDDGKKEVVVLLDVLPDDINVGYLDFGNEVITSVNGKQFQSFADFVKLVENNTSQFCVFETEQKNPIIIDTQNIDMITQKILTRNNIPEQYSADVGSWLKPQP